MRFNRNGGGRDTGKAVESLPTVEALDELTRFRAPATGFSSWSRPARVALLTVAIAVVTWLLSFAALTPERSVVPVAMDPMGSTAQIVTPNPYRLAVKFPVGKSKMRLQFTPPAVGDDGGFTLLISHVAVRSLLISNADFSRQKREFPFSPLRSDARRVSPFYSYTVRPNPNGEPVQIFLEAETDLALTAVVRVVAIRDAVNIEQRVAMGQAARYACLFMMMVLLFSMYLSTGEPVNLAYVWFCATTLLSLLQVDGYLYLMPGTAWFGDLGNSTILGIRTVVVVFAVLLYLHMSQVGPPPPKLARFVRVVSSLLLVVAVLMTFQWMPEAWQYPLSFLYLLECGILVYLAVRMWRNRIPLARVSTLMLCVTVIAVVLEDMNDQGVLQGLWWMNALGVAAMIVWAGLIGISLIRRVGMYRQALEKAAVRQQQLRSIADTDALTGIANRNALNAFLQLSSERSDAGAVQIGVLFVDADHFKHINDTYGHACGDLVLQRMAGILQSTVRSTDRVGRYGGEEFLVIVHDATKEDLLEKAETLRRNIELEVVERNGVPVPFTASIGAALTRPDEDHVIPALERADQALYEAKRNGRNRVEFGA